MLCGWQNMAEKDAGRASDERRILSDEHEFGSFMGDILWETGSSGEHMQR